MSDYEWVKYSGEAWFLRNQPAGNTSVVHENEPLRPVIYDHNGQQMGRPKQPIGFRLQPEK